MFEGHYDDYGDATEKCYDEGGIIAMAADRDTFDFLYNMLTVYRNQGGGDSGVFIDGTRGMMNPPRYVRDWFCVNAGGKCPAAMPLNPGHLNDPQYKCLAILARADSWVVNVSCFNSYMAVCKFKM